MLLLPAARNDPSKKQPGQQIGMLHRHGERLAGHLQIAEELTR